MQKFEHGSAATHFAKVQDAAAHQVVEAERGATLCDIEVSNPDATYYFLQVFDLEAADVSVGVTVPKQSYLIPGRPGAAGTLGKLEKQFAIPPGFKGGISYAITTVVDGSVAPTSAQNVNIAYRYTPNVPGDSLT